MTEMEAENNSDPSSPQNDVEGIFKKRYIQGYMIFLLFFMAFFLRLNLSVAIVAMTDSNHANSDYEELHWDLKTRSEILSSFFWGYLLMQLPAGQLGQIFSVKKLLLVANIMCAILALLTPTVAVHGGWVAMCIIRFLQGISQGFYVPLTYTITSKWIPPSERNRFVGFSLNGGTIGAVVSLALSGILAAGPGGWPSVFYVSGALGLVWAALWWWLGADSPLEHPSIDPRERDFIQAALTTSSQTETYPTPWRAIFTSVPIWALIGVTICNGWGFGILITQLPAYIDSVLGLDVEQNGLLSALPYLSLWVFSFPVCWLADWLTKRKILPTVVIRKLFTTISLGGGSLMVLCLCLVERNAVAAISFTTMSVTFTAFMFSGFNINHLDLGPNFAGVLVGLCNGLENISTIIAPLSVGWIVTEPTSVSQWRWVFLITAMVTLMGNAIFVIFGRADVQSWNYPPTKPKDSTVP